MLEVIKNLLQNIIEDIDAGNSNISENDAVEIIKTLSEYTRKDKGISKYAKLYVPLHCFKNKKVEEYGRRT